MRNGSLVSMASCDYFDTHQPSMHAYFFGVFLLLRADNDPGELILESA